MVGTEMEERGVIIPGINQVLSKRFKLFTSLKHISTCTCTKYLNSRSLSLSHLFRLHLPCRYLMS